jgi:hypothetical protein
MNDEAIEIYVGDVSDMEARVYARFQPAMDERLGKQGPIVLRGTLRGPYCERARTLPAEYLFRDLEPAQSGLAEAVVTDPCLWSEDLPHVYHGEVEAVCGDKVVASFRGPIGLRQAPRNAGHPK